MKISVVTTLYNSAPYINKFYSRMTDSVKKITKDYEIIFVCDGSPDNSLERAVQLKKRDRKVRIIELSRNFGQHKAMMTGLAYAKGAFVFLIDSDLEESPELIAEFYGKMQTDKSIDVVFGVQKKRKGGIFTRLPGRVFYLFFNFLSEYKIPANLTTVRLMKKNFVKSLILHKESELSIGGLWVLTGYNQQAVPVDTVHKGTTSYNLRKKIRLFINSVTSFSNKPLMMVFYIGVFIMFLSIIYVLVILFGKIFLNIPFPGYSSIIVSIWFLGGITVFSIGLVGIYLSRVFIEVKQRPYTIIKKVY